MRHDVSVRYSPWNYPDGEPGHNVTCSCGWASPLNPFASYRDADDEADAHILAMAEVEG